MLECFQKGSLCSTCDLAHHNMQQLRRHAVLGTLGTQQNCKSCTLIKQQQKRQTYTSQRVAFRGPVVAVLHSRVTVSNQNSLTTANVQRKRRKCTELRNSWSGDAAGRGHAQEAECAENRGAFIVVAVSCTPDRLREIGHGVTPTRNKPRIVNMSTEVLQAKGGCGCGCDGGSTFPSALRRLLAHTFRVVVIVCHVRTTSSTDSGLTPGTWHILPSIALDPLACNRFSPAQKSKAISSRISYSPMAFLASPDLGMLHKPHPWQAQRELVCWGHAPK